MQLIAILFAAAPFVFGALRFLTTGTDTRYLWVACASSLGAAVMVFRLSSPTTATVMRIVLATLGASAAAGAASYGLGARSLTAAAVVSVSFGLCSGMGIVLWQSSRSRRATEKNSETR
jgi:hypothetical protein